jgi:hypothetical protein
MSEKKKQKNSIHLDDEDPFYPSNNLMEDSNKPQAKEKNRSFENFIFNLKVSLLTRRIIYHLSERCRKDFGNLSGGQKHLWCKYLLN